MDDAASTAAPGDDPWEAPPATTTPASVTELRNAVDDLESAISYLVSHNSVSWDRLEPYEAQKLYRRIATATRRLALTDTAFLGSSSSLRPAKERQVPLWFARTFDIPLRDAREKVAAASRLDEAVDPFGPDPGAPGPDHLPAVTAAVADGAVGTTTVARLDKQLRDLPATVQGPIARAADAPVAAMLRSTDPDIVSRLHPFLTDLAAAHGFEDPYTDRDRRRLRSLTISPQGADGMSTISGTLTPQAHAVLTRLFADHGAPGDLDGGEKDREDATADGKPDDEDPRTPAQCRHDALLAAVTAGYRPGGPLNVGRGATTIVAAMTVDQLLTRTGRVTTDTGTRISVDALVEDTDVTDVFLQVMEFSGRTLYLGRTARTASLDQYYALVGEEGVSSAPGSSGMPAFADVHHIDPWAGGGPTDLPNLTLVSRHDHRGIDDSRTDDESWHTRQPLPGSVERVDWIPPESLDPRREPRSNPHPAVWDSPGQTLRRVARLKGMHRPTRPDGTPGGDAGVWYLPDDRSDAGEPP
jgi:hypothetical protein